MVFGKFPGSKNHWEEKNFSNFLVQEMSLKRETFVNLLPQKFMTKYGSVSTYSVTFVSQKILTCLQCVFPLIQDNLIILYPHLLLHYFELSSNPILRTILRPYTPTSVRPLFNLCPTLVFNDRPEIVGHTAYHTSGRNT